MTTSPADRDDPTQARITDLATLIATGCGSGLSPVAPGTAGSVVAVAVLALLGGLAKHKLKQIREQLIASLLG